MSLLDRLPGRQPYVRATTDRELIVQRPYRKDRQPDLPSLPAVDEAECTCRGLAGIGQNPSCDAHPWWNRDPTVLEVADLTEVGVPAWEAALKVFGGDR